MQNTNDAQGAPREIRVALFGTSGFAANYLDAFKNPKRPNVKLVAAVDPYAESFELAPLYRDAEQMYKEQRPELVIIATPIQLHREQAVKAFEHGCHVVLEKPLAGSVQDAQAILEARDRYGRLLNVDFQLCYDPVIQKVKNDAQSGRFGRPQRLKVLVLWPRGFSYYGRSTHWAGKRFDAAGRAIYDSVLNNATAHYLMNMLFMTGAPLEITSGKTFYANDVETYDTAVVRGKSAGADMFIAVSHAVRPEEKQDPIFEYRYEKATLRFGARGVRGSHFTAQWNDGKTLDYGIVEQPYNANLWNMVDAIRNGAPILCSGETALLQCKAIESLRAACPEAEPFAKERVASDGSMLFVPGLAQQLFEEFQNA